MQEVNHRKSILTGALFLGAAAAAAAGIAVYVQSPDVRYEAAVTAGSGYVELQQFDLAIAELEEAVSLQEDDPEARQLLMESYAGAGDYDAMLEVLAGSIVFCSEETVQELRESAVLLLEEGAQTAAAVDDVNLAVELYEKVLELAGEESDAGVNAAAQLGELYLEQAVQNSLESFAAVLERDPENLTALEMTADLLLAQGQYEEAVLYYEELEEVSGGAVDVSDEIARCWRETAAGLTGEAAVSAWEKVLEWDPASEEAYLALSELYLEQEDSRNALLVLEQGLEATGSEAILAQYEELNVSEFEQLVIQILESITTEDMTTEEKCRACYDYIIDTTTYVRTYDSPEGDWTKDYAFDVLARQQGNCFRYAAAFAYLCKELGYEVKVCTGEVSAASGGTTPHGWAVVTIDGVEYLCDPDLEQSLGYDFYMKTYEEYPVKPLITEEEWEIEF